MKNFFRLSFLMILPLLASCTQSEVVKISGSVQFVGGGNKNKVTVSQSDGFGQIILAETTINPDNTYSLEVVPANPGVVNITCCEEQRVRAWLEDEDMVINFRGIDTAKVRIFNPPYVHIYAGPKNNLLNLSNYSNYQEYQSSIALSQAVYGQPDIPAQAKQALFSQMYEANNKNARAFNRYLIENNSNLTSCLALLPQLRFETDSSFILDVLAKMEQANPGDTLAKAYLKKLRITQEKKRKMEIGQMAPEFSLTDESGKVVNVRDFIGKVLIIDFWASWCGPCRGEIPSMKKIYADFKDRDDVAFLSISIDSKKADWEKALGEENMEWMQLWAPDSGKELMDKYQFNGIPFIVAIDKEGKIAGKRLRGEAVRKAIEKAL